MSKQKSQLEILAQALLEREVILKSDLVELIGKRPFPEPLRPSEIAKDTLKHKEIKEDEETKVEEATEEIEEKTTDPISSNNID